MDGRKQTLHSIDPNIQRKERNKPLRTYGKRTASDMDSQPPTKRRRKTPEDSAAVKSDRGALSEARSRATTAAPTPKKEAPKPPETSKPSKPAAPSKRSILSYFKPRPPTSSSTPPSDVPSPAAEPSSTPPSSPPPAEVRRVPRRLTTRPALMGSPEGSTRTLSMSPALSPSRDTGSRKKGSGGNKKAVQTTLNLSLQGDLTECRTCGMLYNSVHPKDVKLHARRHATTLKQREIQLQQQQQTEDGDN
ncbi:hypothetical protein MKZ38_002888 [Zalerion maritima]|uniref:N-acetyltransferase ESCO zinc-finger domain-containing protein n=1 Tax=Zalerion maritima TaxID=339359 RepID=A0AAD5WUR0_9PEZI|nr:hypothetical protein MKZ38_002888 [Zalerion maritima]